MRKSKKHKTLNQRKTDARKKLAAAVVGIGYSYNDANVVKKMQAGEIVHHSEIKRVFTHKNPVRRTQAEEIYRSAKELIDNSVRFNWIVNLSSKFRIDGLKGMSKTVPRELEGRATLSELEPFIASALQDVIDEFGFKNLISTDFEIVCTSL